MNCEKIGLGHCLYWVYCIGIEVVTVRVCLMMAKGCPEVYKVKIKISGRLTGMVIHVFRSFKFNTNVGKIDIEACHNF